MQERVPRGFVGYRARRRSGGKLAWFNFELAREMGLLPAQHPDRMTAALRKAVFDTFALQIVNEYDFLNGPRIPERELLPHTYMATRYLQLQHPDKRGKNSGDGRSIWNGYLRTSKGTWDISSCGTGVTRLCPATSEQGVFFKTGNWVADYGCGTAHIEEGIGAAVMSEVFHRNGIATERVLAVLDMGSNLAINVRAARNLLRPSHFFVHLRNDDLDSLRGVAELHYERDLANGLCEKRARRPDRYRDLVARVSQSFARAAARFESEYVFCWLDWDGDNILTDGSIIDYGSVRQFGLFHREYRFEDDVDRMSTTIPEQRRKARHIVQKFVQIREFLTTGEKPALADLRDDPVLEAFEREFALEKRRLLLRKIGLCEESVDALLASPPEALETFEAVYRRFERVRSSAGPHKVADGLSWDAVYCMRDVLRELPAALADQRTNAPVPLDARTLVDIALSDYASRRDRRLTPYRAREARRLQRAYIDVLGAAARKTGEPLGRLLRQVAERAATRNYAWRMTGDGISYVTKELCRRRSRMTLEELYRLVQRFVDEQDLDPDHDAPGARRRVRERALIDRLFSTLVETTRLLRESL